MQNTFRKQPSGFGLAGAMIVVVAILAAGGLYWGYVTQNKVAVGDNRQLAINEAVTNQATITEDTKEESNGSIFGGVKLDLSNQSLTKVPEYVFSRTDLEELNLSGNNLTGALPAEIRHLRNLRVLNVSNNQMTGIPAEIGQLTKLETVDYSNNDITGMPYEMANLKNLRALNLSGNNYSAYDLSIITKDLPNLQVID